MFINHQNYCRFIFCLIRLVVLGSVVRYEKRFGVSFKSVLFKISVKHLFIYCHEPPD